MGGNNRFSLLSKAVVMGTIGAMAVLIPSSPATAMTKTTWLHKWAGHVTGIVNDLVTSETAVIGGSVSRTIKDCRQLDADVSVLLRNAPPFPSHSAAWIGDLVGIQNASIQCIARGEAGASAGTLTNIVINKGLGAENKLLGLLPRLSLKGSKAVHVSDAGISVAPATTTTTAPPPTTTTTSPSQFEASCTNSPAYGALSSPNAQIGVCVTYQAQVFQYDSRTGTTEMLVDVTNDGYGVYTDTVELQLPQSVVSQNFIQNDVIQFWGTTAAADTYQTASGGSNTVPVVDVMYATLITPASS